MMRTRTLGLVATAAAAAGALAMANASAGSGPADYRFRQPLVEGHGVGSLQDLRGVPVLIDFWGTR